MSTPITVSFLHTIVTPNLSLTETAIAFLLTLKNPLQTINLHFIPKSSNLAISSPKMEKKQGFFSALKDEVVRGLSPARSRRKSHHQRAHSLSGLPDPLISRSGSLRPVGEALTPLMEGPDGDDGVSGEMKRGEGWGQWVKGQLSRAPSVSVGGSGRSDLRMLLGVTPVHVSAGEPLPHLSIKDTPIETSSAQYILQQYTAASGGLKLQSSIRNAYAMGKVRMVASEFETATKVTKNRGISRATESGSFVLWQMNPDMWYVELAAGGSKVHAGSNGKIVWRHTPWLGAHAAKGPVRPLRRALQGLDPLTTASMFANARCIGEKKVNGEDCFILKLSADPQTLKARSEGPAEIIRHVLFGYFSQRTGLLVHIEDSHLTRIQSHGGGDAVYWETTINSFLDDYRPVEGIMIAHSGRSMVTLFRFGEMAMSHSKTRMEEAWTIEEVAFNVPGLSMDCFIPPADIRVGSVSETSELTHGEKGRLPMVGSHRSRVAAVGKLQNGSKSFGWRVEV
ncbi:uncharacterized protein A4U43_C08F12400 [Asparagus officinalis]|uniref:uncharacterized protein LOC109819763 n=1 Tax=Asparagus officinalis TaxID=4686 RepID=UPI00098DFB6A|nr:uncharacterized protein LOC109819763 [Asparagus officinalis]ONK59929.1 uncharacterized protein A4U43_C08F12400 [Asparagus officinalis]